MTKIAITSDSHDNIPRIDQMLEILKKRNIKTIIHCGDVGMPSTLEHLRQNFKGQIYLSLGNVDIDHDISENIRIKIFSNFGETEIDDLKIAFVHFPNIAHDLADSNKYDFVFYGHTHKPWEEKINNCRLINPGNLDGSRYQSTFAILDTTLPAGRQETKKIELIIL